MSERPSTRAAPRGAAAASLAGRFEQWVEEQPRAPLVVYGEWRLSYRDVNSAANRLAHRLLALGAGPDVPVGLCLDRGPDLLVAMLAVLKAGAAWVPLDPHWPVERLARMRAIAAPAACVTRTAFLDRVGGPEVEGGPRVVDLDRDQAAIAAGSSANPAVATAPEHWCYVLFTSGSTGTPKGVPVTHGNLAGLFPPLAAALDLGPRDVWTWFHSASFGFSVWEVLGALLHGGSIVIVPEHIRQDPAALGDLIADEGVTVFSQTPSAFRRVLHDGRFHHRVAGSRLRYLALSGEAIRRDDVAGWLAHGHPARLINTYAITETAGQLTLRTFGPEDGTEEGARNLGRPLAGREVLVVDADGRPVAAGEPGELWVGGACVTPGYLGAPELAARFTSLAVPGRGVVRGYLTGDRVRQREDGALEYLGRVDAQLKFRGHRIEPGDIEAALRGHPGVRDAAVGLGTDGAGQQRLTAWVVADASAAATPAAGGGAAEFWPSLGAYGIYDPWLYGLMNAEPVRLAAYRAAFAAAVPGKVVLDIGTGADAVLARLCAEAGAAHVYAVEVLPDAARRARELVASLGLAERITVLEGDITRLTLPRPVEVCTQGIIGNIGSADGIAPVWNAARRLFGADCVPVPARCATRIAALELPAAARTAPRFGPVAADYARRVFAAAGGPFDLRLCLRGVGEADLLSTVADFEVLDFHGALPETHAGEAVLTVTRDGLLDGCLLWTVVTATAGAVVDYFREQQAWLPVFLPLGAEPVAVRAGETLALRWRAAAGSDPVFPDYEVEVRLPDGSRHRHLSRHRGGGAGGTPLHRALLAALEAPEAAGPTVTELRRWLEARLPEHLVPQSWVFLPELPLGPGGKLDRDALPAPGAARPRLAGPHVAPRTPAEAALAALWGEVLGIDAPGVEDDFFDLGGDSIAAVQLTTRVQRWLDAGVPLAALFEAPTIAAFARLLEERFPVPLEAALARAASGAGGKGTGHQGVELFGNNDLAPWCPVPFPPAPDALPAVRDGSLPLTFSQRSLWFLAGLYPGDTSASEQFVIRLRGPLDVARLGRAWTELLARHPVLTAAFAPDGSAMRPGAAGAPALRQVAAGDDAALLALAEAELREPFDLHAGPLVRALLCRCSDDHHELVVTAHHIGADGLSVPVLQAELRALYAGEALPPPPAWADLAADPRWQHGDDEAGTLDWWRQRLAALPSPVLDALVAPPPGPRRSRRVSFVLPAATGTALRRLARATGATPFMVMLAAFRALLARLTGQADLPVGTPMTLRDEAALSGLVGCLVNPVVLRATVDFGRSFREQVLAERAMLLETLPRARVPFARVVEALAPERRLGVHPLFQVLFSWEPAPPAGDGGGVTFESATLPAARASYFDLECGLRDAGEGAPLTGHVAWSTAVVEDWVAEQLPGLLATLLADLLADPDAPVGRAALLPAAVRDRITGAWNATAAPVPAAATLHDLFLARAARQPGAVAVRDGGTVLDAAALEARSAALGAHLLARGVAGRHVGVAIGRSAELVVAVLAVLRAGGTVVPLDPGFPAARLRFMAADADLALLLVTAATPAFAAPGTAVLDVGGWLRDPAGEPPAAVDWPAVPATTPAFMLYTSGSTGEPKGAPTTHGSAVNRIHWFRAWQAFGPDEVFALRTSLNFIDAWWEIFGALAHGVPLQVVPDDTATDPVRLPGFLAATGVTQLVLVPSLLAALLEQLAATGATLPALRWCVTSGEPLPPALVAECRRLLPGTTVLNTYGTSEIWDAAAFDTRQLAPAAARVPIGRSVANVRNYVVDDRGQLLPPGIPGELQVAGAGVGPGYWRRPALTAEKYGDLAVPGVGVERVYRTGDRARFLPDGTLECLGRLDAQFKLRGQRIEPAEIEHALGLHPGVAAAVAGPVGEGAAAVLAAAVVTTPGWQPPPGVALATELRQHLAGLLPAWMVPTAWCALPALPLTPTGKKDRRAGLAAAVAALAGAAAEAVPPATGTERELAVLWQAVLGRAVAGRDDDFFHSGGHSLLAARLLARIRTAFGVGLELRTLFTAPTLAALAAAIDARRAGPAPAAAPDRGTPDDLPDLSWGQERLWFLEQLDPGNPAYNVAWTIRLTGPLDPAALRAALDALVARHAALRTRFPAVDGRPAAVVEAPAPVPLPVRDLRGAGDPEAELQRQLRALAREPFALDRGPLFRATLLTTGDGLHHLLLVIHHIVTDATSNHVLFAELAAALDGRLGPAPAVTGADFARRQRAGAGTPERAADLAWWRARLAGAPTALELPTDRPRPAEQHFAGAWVRRPVPPPLAARVGQVARERGCTPFMVLLAAFNALLHRYAGATDLLVGTPVEGRLAADVEDLVGLCINTLVIRTDASGDPGFGALLARVRDATLDAQAHQQTPFEQLVESLAPERSLARNPVFQVMFNLVQLPAASRRAGAVELHLDRLVDLGVSSFDLTLTAAVSGERLALTFEYATELFDAATVEELADAYLVLLAAALAEPERPLSALPLLAPDRRQARLRQGWLPPAKPVAGTVHEAVAARARLSPQGVAVAGAGERLSYAELEDRAARLAAHLAGRGLGRGARVGICLPRRAEYLVAVLAVLKAGAAYVPLDPDYPASRLEWMAGDAGLAAVIVDATTRGALAAVPRVDLEAEAGAIARAVGSGAAPVRADDTAYVLYTSGSTGRPKGVVVTHGSLANALAGWQAAYGLRPGEAHLQMASAAFDVFTGDWVRALGTGGTLELCPREDLLDPPALLARLRTGRIAVAEFVPAVMRLLVAHCRETGERLAPLRLLIVGSDTWHGSELAALRRVAAAGTRLVNSYGVAEATIDSTWYEASAGPEGADVAEGPVPIGRPFPGVAVYVLDEAGEPLPVGVPGELCIGGHGVAAGYLGDPALTARRFQPDPHAGRPGARLYRTGDRARWNSRGQLELRGRNDGQLKLRGLRIEPGEIEAALAGLPGITGAVAGLRGSGDDARLVAWVVAGTGAGDADAWDAALRRVLPAHLVPAAFVRVDRLPLTPNGKVDRAALAALPPPEQPAARAGAAAGAATPLEATLCRLFAELLPAGEVTPDTDFFRAGGHSLLATRLLARLRATVRPGIPLRSVFEAPTPRLLAAALAATTGAVAPEDNPPVPRPRASGEPGPLSPVQQRLWFLEQLQPGLATYHLHWLVRLRGPLDRAALQAALDTVVARHEVLRAAFTEVDGVPVQLARAPSPVPLILAPAGADESWVAAFVARPFDLRAGPPLRVALLADGPGSHRLLLVIHHLVADGWSFAILARDLGAAYAAARAGRAPELPALPLQYADFALWQAAELRHGRLARELDYWRGALRGAPPLLELRGALLPEPARAAGDRGAWATRVIAAGDLAALKGVAAGEGATLFMALFAAFAAVLGRLGGTTDVLAGTPVAGRPHRAFEDLVGFFVNTLVLRADLGGDPSYRDLLRRVRATALQAFDHAEVPFEKLVEALRPARTPAQTPLVQVLVALHNQPRQPLELEGLEAGVEAVATDTVKFDLNLHAAEEPDGLHLALAWRAGLYAPAAMERLLDHYTDLLRRAGAAPDEPLAVALAAVPPPPPPVAPVAGPPAARGAARPPTATESALLALWGELLGVAAGPDDDFFALGGHSLLATRVVAGIATRCGVELPLMSVFEAPTVRQLAARVDERRATAPAAPPAIPRLPRRPDPGGAP